MPSLSLLITYAIQIIFQKYLFWTDVIELLYHVISVELYDIKHYIIQNLYIEETRLGITQPSIIDRLLVTFILLDPLYALKTKIAVIKFDTANISEIEVRAHTEWLYTSISNIDSPYQRTICFSCISVKPYA